MNLYLSLVLIFLCCAFSALELATRRSYGMFCAILVALFVYIIAEREVHVVPDTVPYVGYYISLDANAEWSSIFEGGFDVGYNLFNLLCKKAGLHYRVFLGLIALIPCLLYLYTVNKLREFSYRGVGLCVKFSLWAGFWGMVWSGITRRVGMALPFAFLAHVLLLKKRYVRAVLSFSIAYTFHSSIVVYPVFLFLSSKVKWEHKSYYIYGGVIILLWLAHANLRIVGILHIIFTNILSLIAFNTPFLYKYSIYIDDVYDSFSSRKNFLFLVMMLFFASARPKNNPQYDHWLRFFAFNLALTFPLGSFIIGYRISDISLISALPLIYHCVGSRKFALDLRICICLGFIISLFIFSLRMTHVY